VRVAPGAALLVERVLILFFHSTEHTGAAAMSQMVLSNIGMAPLSSVQLYAPQQRNQLCHWFVHAGKLQYPAAGLVKEATRPLFGSRGGLLAYQQALLDEHEFLLACASGDMDRAHALLAGIIEGFRSLFSGDSAALHAQAQSDPLYRRHFTAAWVRTRMAASAVPVLERAKEHARAIELLRALLAQAEYCPHSRGSWWDRCVCVRGGGGGSWFII
jgi:hypothetical protein